MAKKRGEHHGGAWKVAYADFVTAMMALFMVLWISAQDQEILIATSRYFQNPFNSPMESSSGVMSLGSGAPADASIMEAERSAMAEIAMLTKLSQEFHRYLNIEEGHEESPIEIQVTNDGLRVLVFNRDNRQIFDRDSAEFTPWGRFVMQNLAWLLERHTFRVRIDGHLSTGYQPRASDYTAWELSADRANAARRALQLYAVPAEQIERVTGFGDTVPLRGKAASDPANERVELSLVLVEPLAPKTL